MQKTNTNQQDLYAKASEQSDIAKKAASETFEATKYQPSHLAGRASDKTYYVQNKVSNEPENLKDKKVTDDISYEIKSGATDLKTDKKDIAPNVKDDFKDTDQTLMDKALSNFGQGISATKDAAIQKVEDAVGFLTGNASQITTDLRSKLSNLIAPGPTDISSTKTTSAASKDISKN